MVKTSYPKEIQFFLEEIIAKIRDVLNPDYILIAGSFGKNSWLYSGNELISDFEFVFICKKRWSLKKKKLLLKTLNKDYVYDISLKGYLKDSVKEKVISNYSSKNPGYISLDFFDTFNDPKFLYIKNDEILDVKCTIDEIPVWEAWRLYVNRMGDLLKFEYSHNYEKQTIDYYWLKIFESTADAYCIVNNIYQKGISKRLEIFNKELIENNNELSIICKNSYDTIYQALCARQNHNLLNFKNDLSNEKRHMIINSWMEYFEKKLSQQEHIPIQENINFINNYINNKSLQKKYLGLNNRFNILISNVIRISHNPKLLNFKFYSNKFSLRHVILLSVSSIFKEKNKKNDNFPNTKFIVSNIINNRIINNSTGKEFILIILKYWKILR